MKTTYACHKCGKRFPCKITYTNHRGIWVDIAEVVKKTCISRNHKQPNQDAEFEPVDPYSKMKKEDCK